VGRIGLPFSRAVKWRPPDPGPAHCRTPARCRSRGVTLTEVVVASALLLGSVVPILHALTAAQAMARQIEWKTRSLTLAQSKLDEIRTEASVEFDQSFGQSSHALDGAYRCTVTDATQDTIRTVTVSVGVDANGDGALASSEVLATLMTKIARR